MLFGSKKIIGVDIGTSSIKLAQLEVGRSSSEVTAFAVMPTPKDSYLNGDILEPGSISNVIREMKESLKIKRKNSAFGLSGSSVVVKKINIPKMDPSLVAEQIKWEAEQYIPYDINEVNVDYQIMDAGDDSSDVMDIMLIAAVQDSIFKSVEVASLSDLNCSIVDVSSFALGNCFLKNYKQSGLSAVLCVGASVSHLVVIENEAIVYTRDIALGGSSYTNELQKGMGITFEEAEDLKITASNDGQVPERVKEIILASHDHLLEEVHSSLDLYLNTSSSGKLNELYLTGGGSRTFGLKEKLGQKFAVEKLNPFNQIKSKSKVLTSEYLSRVADISAVALGLGLRKVGDSK